MNPKPTHTPWKFRLGVVYDGTKAGHRFESQIASCQGSTQEEMCANAAFIVRAVNAHEELTHLLSAALSQIQHMRVDIKGLDGLPSVEHESCVALETQLKDAIAKAEKGE